jgi:peptidoglycan/xylan/chitin deacetylase (PgdA/CDA1 family)
VPAIVFLVTDHVGRSAPFIWDFAAFCFHQTHKRSAEIPLLGPTLLETTEGRALAADQWVECSKRLPASERWPAAEAMRRSLDIEVPHSVFSDFYLTWEDVRQLAGEGMEFGGHTKSHPILTTMPSDQSRKEILDSYERILREVGRPPIAFAYPNGSVLDFDEQHELAVRAAGYSIAFSLNPGPTSLSEVRREPMAIRRIYVGFQDDMPRFAAKLAGGSRIKAGAQLWAFARASESRGRENVRHWDSRTWH